jgi:hypothetical protein
MDLYNYISIYVSLYGFIWVYMGSYSLKIILLGIINIASLPDEIPN